MAPQDATDRPGEVPDPLASELAAGWTRMEDRLRYDYTQVFPPGEEVVEIGGGLKRWVKRLIFRVIRPLIRRYDRIVADVAHLGSDTARSVAGTQQEFAGLRERMETLLEESRILEALSREHDVRIGKATTELELLARRLRAVPGLETGGAEAAPAMQALVSPTSPSLDLPDEFYWRFEANLRGGDRSIQEKLGQYEGLATELKQRVGGDPLWLDLGCGEGQFAGMLGAWGWRVRGMDVSPQAVDACRARGIDAVVGSLPDFLADYEGEAPTGISLIQVIEHLPTTAWLPILRYARHIVAPGGVVLIETIDPRNPYALQWFFGDVTHTWPAHPETLRVMAGFAGFEATEVRALNPDARGEPQDFALLAWAGEPGS